jgi:hypothetical protein
MSVATPAPPAIPTSVYRYYDRFGALIYVGITSRGAARNAQHNNGAPWWPYVVRQSVEHYDDRPVAGAREKALIRQYRPPFNKQHNTDSQSLRDAYLALMQGGLAQETASELAERRGRRLSLVAFGETGTLFRTQPADLALVRITCLRDPVQVYCGDQSVAHVTGWQTHEALGLIEVSKPLPRFSGATARLKFTTQRPVAFRLCRLDLGLGVAA